MFAVVQTGGKQYRISEGDVLEVEKLTNGIGEKVELEVLLVSNDGKIQAGKDVKNVKCTAEIIAQGKNAKVVIYKYKAKKNVRRKQGHRQPFTQIKILEIK